MQVFFRRNSGSCPPRSNAQPFCHICQPTLLPAVGIENCATIPIITDTFKIPAFSSSADSRVLCLSAAAVSDATADAAGAGAAAAATVSAGSDAASTNTISASAAAAVAVAPADAAAADWLGCRLSRCASARGGRCAGIIAPPASAVWEGTAGRGGAHRADRGVGRIEAGREGRLVPCGPWAAVREGGQGLGASIYRVAGGACALLASRGDVCARTHL